MARIIKSIILSLAFIILIHLSNANATLIGTMSITAEEFTSCKQKPEQPVCINLIPIGCKSFCKSEELDPKSKLASACKSLCETNAADKDIHHLASNKHQWS